MRTFAILPVKRFEQAKQRLNRSGAGGAWRKALSEAMLTDVLIALRRTEGVDCTIVVTADRRASDLAVGHGARTLADMLEDGQNAAARVGLEQAAREGCERVLLVPGDCPALDPLELAGLLAEPSGARPYAAIVADRHGTGTNALLLRPPDVLAPAFGPDSFARHQQRAADAGVDLRVRRLSSLALDVDTREDISALEAALVQRRGGAAHTRGILRRADRVGVAPAA